MSYAIFLCETVTEDMLAPLDGNITSWKRELLGNDTATVELAPGALTMANRDLMRLNTTPWRTTLVIEWQNPHDAIGVPVFAGPITTRAFDGQTVTLNAAGFRSLLDRRKIINWVPPYATQSQRWTGMSLGSICVSMLTFVVGNTLPIIYPTIETDTDPTHVKTYNGFNLKTVGSALIDFSGLINGPEHDFTPVWSDGNRSQINWLMRIGTTEQPLLITPSPVAFDATQPGSPVKKLTHLEDASQMATRQWGNGAGSDVDTLMSTASDDTLVNADWPDLEQQKDYKDITVQSTLDAAVAGDLALAQNPIIQFGLEVDGSQPPLAGTYTLGQLCTINVREHIWVPDSPPGGYTMRIITLSGDASTTVKLSMQGSTTHGRPVNIRNHMWVPDSSTGRYIMT